MTEQEVRSPCLPHRQQSRILSTHVTRSAIKPFTWSRPADRTTSLRNHHTAAHPAIPKNLQLQWR